MGEPDAQYNLAILYASAESSEPRALNLPKKVCMSMQHVVLMLRMICDGTRSTKRIEALQILQLFWQALAVLHLYAASTAGQPSFGLRKPAFCSS